MNAYVDNDLFPGKAVQVTLVPFDQLCFTRASIKRLESYAAMPQIPDDDGKLLLFAQAGLIERVRDKIPNGYHIYLRVSDRGHEYLAYTRQLAQDRADSERQQRAAQQAAEEAERAYLDQDTQKHFRHDWRIAVFTTLTGFALGAVADHFFDIVGYAGRAWNALFH